VEIGMKNLLKFLEAWQGAWAAIAALALFCIAPSIVQTIWPTDAGVMPGSYIQLLIWWSGIYFFGIAMAWVSYQFDFRETDKKLDNGDYEKWFNDLQFPAQKLFWSLLPWLVLLLWAAVSLFAAVKILS
jgi:hypothetical protein